ncbi:MAG: hypothetical protein QXI93_05250 [Candidatus Methanomethylicia archaeon]
MLVYIVIASINPLVNLNTLNEDNHDIKVIVVDEGDESIRKVNSEILSKVKYEYYGPRERESWFKERFGASFERYLSLIPERCHAETSFGFLKAFEDGADVIIELDDDVHIFSDFVKGHIENLSNDDGVTVNSNGKWYNTIENLSININGKIFPRGHPYESTCRLEDYIWSNVGGDCVLNMGLWNGHPDLDALTLIHYGGLDGRGSIEGLGLKRNKIIVGKGTYFSICSMNTSFISKIIPAFYQLYMNFMGVDRFDDIWSGIFLKRISDHIGDNVCLGKPLCRHDKRVRNVFKDLLKETNGLEMNEYIWKICENIDFSSKTYPDCYLELAYSFEKNIERWFKDGFHIKFWKFQIEKMRRWVELIDRLD